MKLSTSGFSCNHLGDNVVFNSMRKNKMKHAKT